MIGTKVTNDDDIGLVITGKFAPMLSEFHYRGRLKMVEDESRLKSN